jgi:SNF2 family DNA or RNA helicase
MTAKLFDWQEPSATKLTNIFSTELVALDASDTGAGKTYVALQVVKNLGKNFLVICPKSVRSSWVNTSKDFGLTPMDIITPQRLQFKNPYYVEDKWTLDATKDMIVWDEIQQGTSGPDTKTTKALGRVKVYKLPLIALSATIADNSLKLRGLGFLLGLHEFNKASFRKFCFAHGCYKSPFAMGALEFSKGKRGKEAMLKLHDEMKDFMVRIKHEDIPKFPMGHILANLYDLDVKFTKEIKEIYAELDDRLKQPGVNSLVELGIAREKTELFKVPLLAELVKESLDEGISPVVFINYHSTREALVDLLSMPNVAQIHGKQNDTAREQNIESFQNNKDEVAVVMTAAGGAGISLHDLHGRPRNSWLCPNYNSTLMKQCLGRIHRVGGSAVTQTFVLAAGTIEETIHRAIKRKIAHISLLNDGDLTLV